MMEKLHQEKLERLKEQIRKFYSEKKKFRLYHGSTNTMRVRAFKKEEVLDISDFNQVLQVNKKEKFVLVEPNVNMGTLVKKTLEFALLPPVVMEFPAITVGGGIQGGSGESSGFKYGAFEKCFFEYEVVLGNGEVVAASEKENSDLFYSLPSSFGSLGIITKAKMRLIDARKFVRLTYQKTKSFDETIELISKLTKTKIDFLEGIVFSKTEALVLIGELTDDESFPLVNFSKAADPWFFLHVEEKLRKNHLEPEITPLKDYLFRYDRGSFWTGKSFFERTHLPFNSLSRGLLDPILRTKQMYRLSQAFRTAQESIVQDICLPKEKAVDFLNYLEETLKIYPLWLCPELPSEKEFLSSAHLKTDLVINVGLWKRFGPDRDLNLKINRELEIKTRSLLGRKSLYAENFYSESEFWSIYDRASYDLLRKKYFAERSLPTIFQKVVVKEKFKKSLLGGFFSILLSPSKLPLSQ